MQLTESARHATTISLKGVTKTYRRGRQAVTALSAVDLEINQGEFVAITGPSGSGKSTLLQLIGGLDKPSEGLVEVDGVDISVLSDSKLSKFRGATIGYVFQFFYMQPFLTMARNVELPGAFSGLSPKIRTERQRALLKRVGLEERGSHLPSELSGGQLQRALIARALLNNPKVLLADEPTGNLDTKNSESIIGLFETIRRELGTTIVVITHDPAIADRADRQIKLVDGTIEP